MSTRPNLRFAGRTFGRSIAAPRCLLWRPVPSWMPAPSIRTLWNDPAVADAPGPRRRDWWFVGAMGIVALVEGVLRTHMVWRVLSIVLFLAMVADALILG